MALKVDLESYRDRAGAPAAEPAPPRMGVRAGAGSEVNWKIVRALGLALLVWGLIAAVLLSL